MGIYAYEKDKHCIGLLAPEPDTPLIAAFDEWAKEWDEALALCLHMYRMGASSAAEVKTKAFTRYPALNVNALDTVSNLIH